MPYIDFRILLTMLIDKDLALSALTALGVKRQSILRPFYYDGAMSVSLATLPSLLEVADLGRITYRLTSRSHPELMVSSRSVAMSCRSRRIPA